jgi:hypothetical protein
MVYFMVGLNVEFAERCASILVHDMSCRALNLPLAACNLGCDACNLGCDLGCDFVAASSVLQLSPLMM